MRLALRIVDDRVTVDCDGVPSHAFPLGELGSGGSPADGAAMFRQLFPPGRGCGEALARGPARLIIEAADPRLHEIGWESLRDARGLLAARIPIVRLEEIPPRDHRRGAAPAQAVVAVPSAPLTPGVRRLDVPGELDRIIQSIAAASRLDLARVRPATVRRLGEVVAECSPAIVHFMGHAHVREGDGEPCLLFEEADGGVAEVDAALLLQWIAGHAPVVVLNACSTARAASPRAPSLARALVRGGIPCVVGMQQDISDPAAVLFAETLHGLLGVGESVEEAVRKARLELDRRGYRDAACLPVVHASVEEPVRPARAARRPLSVRDPLPRMALQALPAAEGSFVGRRQELLALGAHLTRQRRGQLVSIVGPGGEGKTALARAACERFAFAFPGGLYGVEITPASSRESVAARLASLLGGGGGAPALHETGVLDELRRTPALVVVDGLEAALDTLEHPEGPEVVRARALLAYVFNDLRNSVATLLVTTRRPTGRPGEQVLSLDGLDPSSGAALFLQCAPRRSGEADLLRKVIETDVSEYHPRWEVLVAALDQRVGQDAELAAAALAVTHAVDGHPLCLRLLGGEFDHGAAAPRDFVDGWMRILQGAADPLKGPEHRQRTIHACIESSIAPLPESARALLATLRALDGFVIPEVIAAAREGVSPRSHEYRGTLVDVGEPEYLETSASSLTPYEVELCQGSRVYGELHELWKRSLLLRHVLRTPPGDGRVAAIVHQVVPAVLAHLRTTLGEPQAGDADVQALARASAPLADALGGDDPVKRTLARGCVHDLERLAAFMDEATRAPLLVSLAGMFAHLGQIGRGAALAQAARELVGAGHEAGGGAPGARSRTVLEADLMASMDIVATLGDPRGMERLDDIVRRCEAEGDGDIVLVARLNRAHGLLRTGALDGAREAFREVFKQAKRRADWSNCASALDGMAVTDLAAGKAARAARHCRKALALLGRAPRRRGAPVEPEREPSVEANLLHNLGEAQRRQGRREEAMESYRRASELRRQVGSLWDLSITLHNIAQIHLDLGQGPEAQACLAEALESARQVDNVRAQGAICMTLAHLHGRELDRCTAFLREAVDCFATAGDVGALAAARASLAQSLARDPRSLAEALAHAQQGLALLESAHLAQDAAGASIDQHRRLVARLGAGLRSA